MAIKFKQGKFLPRHPEKYIGNIDKIRYMSSWEYNVHKFFDENTRVIRWSSEEIAVPYLKPTDGKIHKYYPDYYVEYVDVNGEIIKELIEVKPLQQTKLPRSNNKHRLYEQLTYAVNQSKWMAAKQYADQHGWKFRVITENSIFR
ncbi:MAG: TnsA endonuclease N-terminal domain-containing protein [Nitrososphaeraceae archaeon]